MTDSRPLRSVLYMPASNARAMAKARTLDCDAVALDLEDAVAPEAKADARAAQKGGEVVEQRAVARHEFLGVRAGEQPPLAPVVATKGLDDFNLQRISVLEFVDHQQLRAAGKFLANRRVRRRREQALERARPGLLRLIVVARLSAPSAAR